MKKTCDKIDEGGEKMSQVKELESWVDEISQVHLPRWHELPELDLYMDQVVTLVERYLSPLMVQGTEKMLTKSMVNNYVKLQLIPAPVKKQYSRRHLAFLIAITVLKQVVTIKEVKQGIMNLAKVTGEKNAYNYFVEEQERAIHGVANSLMENHDIPIEFQDVDESKLALKMASMAFATKIAAERLVFIQSGDDSWAK